MPEHIQKHFGRLLIVSDTAMYKVGPTARAFGPVVHELEYISDLFSEINWIGYNQPQLADNSILKIINCQHLHIHPLQSVGGNTFKDKLYVLARVPGMLYLIYKRVKQADVIHTRGPSVPALIAICLSFILRKKIWWHKYAGNWSEPNPPLAYRLQRWLLSKLTHTYVTINGQWPNQQPHLLSFENPCLYETLTQVLPKSSTQNRYIICYVGALNDKKGLPEIIGMLNDPAIRSRISTCYIVGDGPPKDRYQAQLVNQTNVVFTGYLGKDEVNIILKQSHFIILPSHSEGFPKVIAEAAAFGTVPIVSDVSCIGQYITPDKGYLWQPGESLPAVVNKALSASSEVYTSMSVQVNSLAPKFTYTYFKQQLISRILQHAG